MTLVTVKRLAASLLGVGKSRVRILNPKKAADALTRDDVRELIRQGFVMAVQKKGVGTTKRDRTKGRGHRKGTKAIGKKLWMRKVRAQRDYLVSVKQRMESPAYRKAYVMVKGNAFRDVATLKSYLVENKMIKQ